VSGVVKGALVKRASGDKPSPVHAAVAATLAGIAAAALMYKVMRS
jgi:hypothetical protein